MLGFGWFRGAFKAAARWFGARSSNPVIPPADTFSQRIGEAVHEQRERTLLRGAEEGIRKGRSAEAIEAYRALVGLYEDRAAHAKLAAVLANLVRLEPDNPEWPSQLAEVEHTRGHPRLAASWWARAADLLRDCGQHEAAANAWANARAVHDPAPITEPNPPSWGTAQASVTNLRGRSRGEPTEARRPGGQRKLSISNDPTVLEDHRR